MDAALKAYRSAERVYRVLYWGARQELRTTFMALVELIQTTGHWPDLKQLAEKRCICPSIARTFLNDLELMGFINIKAQTVCFPIIFLPKEILETYMEIVELIQEEPYPLQIQAPIWGLKTRFVVKSEEEIVSRLNTLVEKGLIRLTWNGDQEVVIHLIPSAELAYHIGLSRYNMRGTIRYILNTKLEEAISELKQ